MSGTLILGIVMVLCCLVVLVIAIVGLSCLRLSGIISQEEGEK
jgi:hypothetical protein